MTAIDTLWIWLGAFTGLMIAFLAGRVYQQHLWRDKQ